MHKHHMNVFQDNHWKKQPKRQLGIKRRVEMKDLNDTLQLSSRCKLAMDRRGAHDGTTWLNDSEMDGLLTFLTFGTKPGHFHTVSTLITNEATTCASETSYPSKVKTTVTRTTAASAEAVYPYAQKLVDAICQQSEKTPRLPFLFYPVNQGGNHWILFVGVNVLEDDNSHNAGYFAYNPMGDKSKDVADFTVRSGNKLNIAAAEAGFLLFVDALRAYASRAPSRHPNTGVPYMDESGKHVRIVARYNLTTTSTRFLRRLSIPAGFVERQPNGYDCGIGVLLLCFQFIRRFPQQRLYEFNFHKGELKPGTTSFTENYRYKLKDTVLTNKQDGGGLPWKPYKQGDLRMSRFRQELFGWMDRCHVLLHGSPTADVFIRRLVYRPLEVLDKVSIEPELEEQSKVDRTEFLCADMAASDIKKSTSYKEWRPAVPYVPVLFKTLSTSKPLPKSLKKKLPSKGPSVYIRSKVKVEWVMKHLTEACAMQGKFPEGARSNISDMAPFTAWDIIDGGPRELTNRLKTARSKITGVPTDKAPMAASKAERHNTELEAKVVGSKSAIAKAADDKVEQAAEANSDNHDANNIADDDPVDAVDVAGVDATDTPDAEGKDTTGAKHDDTSKPTDLTLAVLSDPPTKQLTQPTTGEMEVDKVMTPTTTTLSPESTPASKAVDPAEAAHRQRIRLARQAAAAERRQKSEAHKIKLESWKVATQLRNDDDRAKLPSKLKRRLERARQHDAKVAKAKRKEKERKEKTKNKTEAEAAEAKGEGEEGEETEATTEATTEDKAENTNDTEVPLPMYRRDIQSVQTAPDHPGVETAKHQANEAYWGATYSLSAADLFNEEETFGHEQLKSDGATMEAAFHTYLAEQIRQHNSEMKAANEAGNPNKLNTTVVLMPDEQEEKWAAEEVSLNERRCKGEDLLMAKDRTSKDAERGQRILFVCDHERKEIAREKRWYYGVVEDFRQEWMTEEKGVVLGLKYTVDEEYVALCLWRRPLGATVPRRKRPKTETTTIVPKQGNTEAYEAILSEIPVDEAWIEDNWGFENEPGKMSNMVRMQTTKYNGFYPTKNQKHQGWIAMESKILKGIRWNKKRMVKVESESAPTDDTTNQPKKPAPVEYRLDPGWEMLLENNQVVPKTREELDEKFGKAYMVFIDSRRGMRINHKTRHHIGFMLMKLGAVEVRPDITDEMLANTKAVMTTQGLSERPSVQFPQGNLDICVAAAAASALYAAGLKVEAETVMEWSSDDVGIKKVDPMLQLIKVLKDKQYGGFSHLETTRFDRDNIQLLVGENDVRDIEPWVIFVVAVVDSNQKADHAIAIYNGWIYDANMRYAIPYDRVGLDFITKTATIDNETGKTYNPTSTTFQKARIAYGIYESRKRNVKNLSRSTAAGHDVYGESPPPSKPWKKKQTKKAKK